MVVSVGTKSTCRVRLPAFSTVPAAGVYVNAPGTLAVAFNCVPLRAVPYTMFAGLLQVITGVACVTVMLTSFDVLE